MYDVLSVGNANIDLIVNDDKLPKKPEFFIKPGGSACNFAVGCARLGLKSGFLGFTGKDEFGSIIRKNLIKEKVKPLIKVVKDQTGFVVVFTKKRFKKFLKFEGANKYLHDLKLKNYLSKTKHLHLATPPLSLLKQARGSISVDPGSRLSRYKLDELKPYLKKIDIFFPNEEEAKIITGYSYKRAARELFEAGVNVSIVKLGKGGCYLVSKDEEFHTKNLGYPPIDTTGAGDAFASAFISAWHKGKSLREACEWAIISSNICVTKLGAQNSATLKELKQIKSFKCC